MNTRIISVYEPKDYTFNFEDARYKIPVTVIIPEHLLNRLRITLQSRNCKFFENARWIETNKPEAIRQVNKYTYIKTIYKDGKFIEVKISEVSKDG